MYFSPWVGFYDALTGKQDRKLQSKALGCLCLSKTACVVVTGLC